MWPWVLGSAGLGALTSGIQGYRQSGGDLGATLRAAATGGLLGGATGGLGAAGGGFAASRMAGALPLEMLAKKQAMGLGLTGIEKAMMAAPAITGGVANIGTQLAAGSLLAPAAAATANLAGQAARGVGQAGAAVLGAKPEAGQYDVSKALPPGASQFGYGANLYGTPLDIASPFGQAAGGREEYSQQIKQAATAMKALEPLVYQAREAAAKSDYQRQLAANIMRTNVSTAASMLQRNQQAAQQMGTTALQQAGQALTQQYQYA